MNQRKDSVPSSPHGLSHWLIHTAALHAPQPLCERLEEEWLADMAARPSAYSRLRFAVGCCWATRVIVYEQRLSLVPATSSVAGSKLVAALGQFNWGHVSRRSSTLFLILSLHVAVFYVVMSSISHKNPAPDRFITGVAARGFHRRCNRSA
jgi:hypothetical protein